MTVLKLDREIHNIKTRLIAKANRKGLWENFGEKESRVLHDKYMNGDNWCISSDGIDELLKEFRLWCGSYCVEEKE